MTNTIVLEITPEEFKLVTRALCGELDRKGHDPEEPPEARELGKKLLHRHLRQERDRLGRLGRTLNRLREEDSRPEPAVTELRPGSVLG